LTLYGGGPARPPPVSQIDATGVQPQVEAGDMTEEQLFATLLHNVRQTYRANAALCAFTPFPDDVKPQPVAPHHCTCSDVFRADTGLRSQNYPALQDAIRASSDAVHWRETYKGTNIGADFLDRFGCYCIIGENAPFWSDALRLFMVYMPAHFDYTWHHHPAEEVYMVVSGKAVFKRENCPDQWLGEGQTSFHESNQPHAMETKEEPVLCLVAWRNEFETPPALTR